MNGIVNGFLNPLHLYSGPVRSLACIEKVLGKLQLFALSSTLTRNWNVSSNVVESQA